MRICETLGMVEKPTCKRSSEREYRGTPRLSPSSLVKGLSGETCDPYALALEYERPSISNDSMDCGTLAHRMVLEPETVNQTVAIWEGKVRRGGEWEAFQEQNADKLIVRGVDFREVAVGASVAAANKHVRKLLTDCEIEHGYTWTEAVDANGNGIRMRGRPDAVSTKMEHGRFTLPDLKFTEAGLDQRSIERTIVNMHYREKMAMYRRAVAMVRGIDVSDIRCKLIFVRLSAPYGVTICDLGSDGLDWAERRMLTLIHEVKRCIEHNAFAPMYSETAFGLTSWELADEQRKMEGE